MSSPPSARPDLPLVPRLPQNAAVKIVGLGGVGGIVARYLSMYLASLDQDVRLVFIDGDQFEPANATRMYFSRPGNKAQVVREELIDRFVNSRLSLVAIEEFVSAGNVGRLLHEGDIIILAVDNHATRKLVNDHCARLADVCLISGGNDGVGKDSYGRELRGTYGNVQLYVRRHGRDSSPSLAKFHPEIDHPPDLQPAEEGCTIKVATAPQLLVTNAATAVGILITFWLHVCGSSHFSELCFDVFDAVMKPAPLPPPEFPEADRAVERSPA